MKDKKLIKNILFYTIKQISAIIFPMIVYPYVTRVLGVNNLGKVEYAKSLVQYFLLFAGLGISDYAIREGARIRDDKKQLNRFSTQIIVIHIISTTIACIGCMLLTLTSSFKIYDNLIYIFMVMIPFTMIGMNWIFCIFEDYQYISIRTMFFQLISLGLTFVLIRKEDDYIYYALILVISNVGANILNLFKLRRYIKLDFTDFEMLKHLKPIFIIFGMAAASSIYMTMDISMLGFISGTLSVGYYAAANKLIVVIGTLVSSIRTVLLPRLSFMIGTGDKNGFKNLNALTLNIILMFAVPITFGIFTLSREIIVLFCGSEFMLASMALKLLAPSIILSAINGYFIYQILMPLKKENLAFISIISGAITNILINIILIPIIRQDGAAIATCISELIVLLITIFLGRKYIYEHVSIKNIINELRKYFTAAFIMMVLCFLIKNIFSNYVYRLIVAIPICAVIYMCILILLKGEIIINIIQKLKGNKT